VPAIGVALDLGKSEEPYWQPIFAGYEPTKVWIAREKPDVIILVYNDHASSFSLEIIPTFAILCRTNTPSPAARATETRPAAKAVPKLF
jgi:hypothetical protein